MMAVACGPSAAEIRRAHTAVYKCDEGTVRGGIAAELKSRAGQFHVDERSRVLASDYRWHTATGVPHQKGTAMIGPGDVAVGFAVRYERREPGWLVRAKVNVLSHVVGSPRGRVLGPKDADWPDWANDKVDTFLVSVHKRLKSQCPEVVYLK